MAEASDTAGMIYQNLVDAGCDTQTIEACMSVIQTGNWAKALLILSQYRTSLLGTVRIGQKQIDCLDYFIYKIQTESI